LAKNVPEQAAAEELSGGGRFEKTGPADRVWLKMFPSKASLHLPVYLKMFPVKPGGRIAGKRTGFPASRSSYHPFGTGLTPLAKQVPEQKPISGSQTG